MKWSYIEPSKGDMVRVAVGSIYHFGIYVSDDEVIQFGLPPSRRSRLMDSEVEVLASGIDEFLDGGFLEVCEFDRKERKNNRTPDEIVSYARSKIGMRGYHIIHNNCEHFANECVSGSKVCSQTDSLRTMFNRRTIWRRLRMRRHCVRVYRSCTFLMDFVPVMKNHAWFVSRTIFWKN